MACPIQKNQLKDYKYNNTTTFKDKHVSKKEMLKFGNADRWKARFRLMKKVRVLHLLIRNIEEKEETRSNFYATLN